MDIDTSVSRFGTQGAVLDFKVHDIYGVRHASHSLLAMLHLIHLPDTGFAACLARVITLSLILIHLVLTDLPRFEGKLPPWIVNSLAHAHAATHFFLFLTWAIELALLDFIPPLGFKALAPMFNMLSCLAIFLANFDFFPLVFSLAHC
ncbi:hypothetical protein DSO57_1039551 [Entomophthora muscae]|uniref:Uncharacterized protein n=1 Tax=Entomophthora muscae TaxID=34485 RepID=A0ACC2S0N8_9FUNG|nr:hypothetical protein DSO57_1039551 [Entomophthora muscae]